MGIGRDEYLARAGRGTSWQTISFLDRVEKKAFRENLMVCEWRAVLQNSMPQDPSADARLEYAKREHGVPAHALASYRLRVSRNETRATKKHPKNWAVHFSGPP
jgi:hypothetical protein